MANKFWVDWDDPAYPRIRPASEAPNHTVDLRSLNQCKQQIINHAREHRSHWMAIINNTKALTDTEIYQGKN